MYRVIGRAAPSSVTVRGPNAWKSKVFSRSEVGSDPSQVVVSRELIATGLHDLVTSTRGARSVDEISAELTQRRLRSVPVFSDLPARTLARIAAASHERRVPSDTTLATEGAHVAEVVVVLDGYAGAEHGGVPAIVLGPGAVLGAPEAIDGLGSATTIVSQTPMVLRCFPASDFMELVAGIPPLALAVIRQLGGRTRTVLDELVCARQGSVTPNVGAGSSSGVRRSSSVARPARNRRSSRYH